MVSKIPKEWWGKGGERVLALMREERRNLLEKRWGADGCRVRMPMGVDRAKPLPKRKQSARQVTSLGISGKKTFRDFATKMSNSLSLFLSLLAQAKLASLQILSSSSSQYSSLRPLKSDADLPGERAGRPAGL